METAECQKAGISDAAMKGHLKANGLNAWNAQTAAQGSALVQSLIASKLQEGEIPMDDTPPMYEADIPF